MNFLISNGGERGHYHVEAIKPGPALNEVKTRRAHQHDRGARAPDQRQKLVNNDRDQENVEDGNQRQMWPRRGKLRQCNPPRMGLALAR